MLVQELLVLVDLVVETQVILKTLMVDQVLPQLVELVDKEIVVDKVLDVLHLPEDRIQPPPETEKVIERQFLEGICEWQEEMLILINLDTLFDQDPSLQLIEETQHSITPIQ